ncbi:helix-turn-helix domain-containing protein [Bacillus piscicola]|uniref:helix-turn-helix domain-containing protein n=1 Tax=Bacillus piscicola TaxID=1632684 RepID=UPI001F088CDD|nr:helix-turn-helix transcriptional regulator [Bacillus piscicola]
MKKRTLGSYVNEMRVKNKLSLRELGKRTNLSFSYIHSIESDKVKPSRDAILALAEGLKGAFPDEMLRLGGLLPDPIPENNPPNVYVSVFSRRLRECIEQKKWTSDVLAAKTNIDISAIRSWLDFHTYAEIGDSIKPELINIYKIADALGVTADYLAGYAENPDEYHPAAPRPKNLRHILASEELVLDHIPLDKKAKEKIIQMIYAVFNNE